MVTSTESGFVVHDAVLAPAEVAALAVCFAPQPQRAGHRGGLDLAVCRAIAGSAVVRSLVEPWLGPGAIAIRATLFDKTPVTNWLVAWHQDRVVPVRQRHEVPGYRAWSAKDGAVFVEPPVAVLQQMVAVRLDLDGSDGARGGLRLVPGSHRDGVLTPAAIAAKVAAGPVLTPVVPAGGALVLRPLLLHASSRAHGTDHRRIVHLEFAAGPLPPPLQFADSVR
jgi:ectoine hydroxylase-related dioxygenase (phytanoyl-CoA dioxygenase family)